MTDKAQRSMLKSAPAVVTMVIGLLLLSAALWRWREAGWGGLVWLAALLVTTAIRWPHSMRNRANAGVSSRKDATEQALLAAMFLGAMLLPLLDLATPLLRFADYDLPDRATAIGALLQLPYLWLFWRSHADLGRNWSVGLEVHDAHALVTNGIYAQIRHPMYAAIWISALAQPLLIHNWIAGLFVVPAFAAMWFLRVPREEALMRERFGADWDAYCARSGQLWPRGAS